jgi:hypothetical protein
VGVMTVTDVYQAIRSRRVVRLPVLGLDDSINELGNSADPLFFCLHGRGDIGSTFINRRLTLVNSSSTV